MKITLSGVSKCRQVLDLSSQDDGHHSIAAPPVFVVGETERSTRSPAGLRAARPQVEDRVLNFRKERLQFKTMFKP